jgi:hypothetical protein
VCRYELPLATLPADPPAVPAETNRSSSLRSPCCRSQPSQAHNHTPVTHTPVTRTALRHWLQVPPVPCGTRSPPGFPLHATTSQRVPLTGESTHLGCNARIGTAPTRSILPTSDVTLLFCIVITAVPPVPTPSGRRAWSSHRITCLTCSTTFNLRGPSSRRHQSPQPFANHSRTENLKGFPVFPLPFTCPPDSEIVSS